MIVRLAVFLIVVMSLLPLAGCRNGFKEFYTGEHLSSVESAQVVTSPPANTRLIGSACFVSAGREGDAEAISAARSIGANYVSWSSQYQGTTQSSGVMPVTTPTSNTTYYQSYSQGNVYSPGGYAGNYSGNTTGSATTYGSTTNYIPYTVTNHWMKYDAQFFRSVDLESTPPKR